MLGLRARLNPDIYHIHFEFRMGDCRFRSGKGAGPLQREQRGSRGTVAGTVARGLDPWVSDILGANTPGACPKPSRPLGQ